MILRCLLFQTANEENASNLIHACNLTHITEDICNAASSKRIANIVGIERNSNVYLRIRMIIKKCIVFVLDNKRNDAFGVDATAVIVIVIGLALVVGVNGPLLTL